MKRTIPHTALTSWLAVLVLLLSSGFAEGGLILYGQRSLWENAITALGGSVSSTVDFNTFTSDTSFATNPVDLGSFTLQKIAGDLFGNLIDTSPFTNMGSLNGTPFAFISADGNRQVRVTFDEPVLGFGGDIHVADISTLRVNLQTSAGDSIGWNADTLLTVFRGVVVTDTASAFNYATFSAPTGVNPSLTEQTFGFDNVAFGTSAITTPEPSSFVLLASGLSFIAARVTLSRRRNLATE